LHTSILINKKLGDLDGEARNLSYIGTILGVAGDWDGAVSAYQMRIWLARQLNDLRGEATGCWNLGEIYIRQKKYRLGLELLHYCIEYENSSGDPAWEADSDAVKKIEDILAAQKNNGLEANNAILI
jgi:hypothetical protein